MDKTTKGTTMTNNDLTLALTKIGDLLAHNQITKNEDGKPIKDIFLDVPAYQRPYKWTAKNANQLLNDIDESMKQNKEVYRVGTLILHRHEKDGRMTYDIVDGQQRMITFSLLLSCFDDVEINFLNRDITNNAFSVQNVSNNYRALRRRIDGLKKQEREKLKGYILESCELIVVITKDLSEAFQFFDSQNARGKALYPHDLLKAYHLREMNDLDEAETEKVVKTWENLDQKSLSKLFQEYLYRLKEWVQGNRATELTERNIDLFKGVSAKDNYPFAQYYKGAFSYAEAFNQSSTPFVTGVQKLRPFQLNAPVIAGKPFFEYAKYYYDILADIQDNDKYEGYFIKDNSIVKTLDLRKYKNGTGNRITRLMFDTAILLYVDRFCPGIPSGTDTELLEQFVEYAFIWAYSMRAQYQNVGWLVAQNYILGKSDVVNSYNIYKVINEADSPVALLSRMAEITHPITNDRIKAHKGNWQEVEDGVQQNYLYYFNKFHFWEVQ